MWDLFFYTESNRHHPINDADAKCVSVSYTIAATPDEVIRYAQDNRLIARGSSRCGVTEIHTDAGIYKRVGPNLYSGDRGASKFTFKTWDQIDRDEEMNDGDTNIEEVAAR